MVRSQVADRGDGLQIWRVGVNIFNKSYREPTRGGPPACDSGYSLTIHNSLKIDRVTKHRTKSKSTLDT